MTYDKRLLVEGIDDQHVVWALLKKHNIPQVFNVEERNGFESILKTFPVELKGSEISVVGIIVDADVNVRSRWQSVRSALVKLDYTSCPEVPPAEGIVLNERGKPRFGAWIMPDNTVSGMLEDFVAHLVPDGDDLWSHSCRAIDDIPANLRLFAHQHVCKVRIHTWLAWQKDPGTPMGLAITKRYLDGDAQKVRPFMAWLDRLFVAD